MINPALPALIASGFRIVKVRSTAVPPEKNESRRSHLPVSNPDHPGLRPPLLYKEGNASAQSFPSLQRRVGRRPGWSGFETSPRLQSEGFPREDNMKSIYVGMIFLSASFLSLAHHGTGTYDSSKSVTLNGTVT